LADPIQSFGLKLADPIFFPPFDDCVHFPNGKIRWPRNSALGRQTSCIQLCATQYSHTIHVLHRNAEVAVLEKRPKELDKVLVL
jgi:hypothetical protein